MVSWGVEVNDYGNAILDDGGNLKKVKGEGVSEEMWAQMTAYAEAKGWKSGDYKKLNLPFEPRLLGQPRAIRERMAKRVEDFVYTMLTDVFYAEGSATLAREVILENGSYDFAPKVGRIEDPAQWTRELIVERAGTLDVNKGPEGHFDD